MVHSFLSNVSFDRHGEAVPYHNCKLDAGYTISDGRIYLKIRSAGMQKTVQNWTCSAFSDMISSVTFPSVVEPARGKEVLVIRSIMQVNGGRVL